MKLYVPNQQTWMDFFQSGRKMNQSGRGKRPHVIPVIWSKEYSIRAVLPSEQSTAQVKSELERQDINPRAVEKTVQSFGDHRRKRKGAVKSTKLAKKPKIKVIRKKDIFDKNDVSV